ncbi:MAG: TetR/AcrR family transcriptional regulator [Pseudomonadota bacterium]
MKHEREDWIRAAKRLLLTDGIDAVRVDRIAKKLGVTRGGFYGYFKNRKALLDELVAVWRAENTEPILDAIAANAPDGEAQYVAVTDVWVSEKDFSPAFDAAMRDWARIDAKIEKHVREVDDIRIEALRSVFKNLGYRGNDAKIRARVMYYHQVGYYTLGVKETLSERNRLQPFYKRALIGR